MTASNHIKAGDFTQLADNYAKYRPGYSETVLDAIFGIIKKKPSEIDFVDIGAGTGIWSREVAKRGCKTVIAIEPNDAMRLEGLKQNSNFSITWLPGSAEETTLPDECADMVSMASSFHWANFGRATKEFHRILKPNGYFCMLWNPRRLELNPMLLEIEDYIYTLMPDISRISSGKSNFVNELSARLEACDLFTDMIHIEGTHTVNLSHEEYLGAWMSVNDIRVQLGEFKFQQFIKYVTDKIDVCPIIHCSYLTRAWIVRKQTLLQTNK